jgi:hypothetical protein
MKNLLIFIMLITICVISGIGCKESSATFIPSPAPATATAQTPTPTPTPFPTSLIPTTKPAAPPAPSTPTLKDPSYYELLNFLKADDTDQINDLNNVPYIVQKNARVAGWNCATVLITTNKFSITLNAFNTTDKGIIYINDRKGSVIGQTGGFYNWDRKITVEVGKAWICEYLFTPSMADGTIAVITAIGPLQW